MEAVNLSSSKRYGVLLINMGGPSSLEEISPFLYRLFTDPLIMPLPGFIRKLPAFLISRLRRKTAAARYALIGGKSPLDEETAQQARQLRERLQLPVTYAMRYTAPEISTALELLQNQGVSHLAVIPLYPQYSLATTLSAIKQFKNKHAQMDGAQVPAFDIIQSHYGHPEYIRCMANLLARSLSQCVETLKTEILFVAHSIPLRQVRKGDPYVQQVRETVTLVNQALPLPYPHALAFQSRLGPVKWQGPSLEETLRRLKRDRVRQLVVQPLSFVSENLETRYDLDHLFKNQCLEAGIANYIRVPAPGTDPAYCGALAALVREKIAGWENNHV